MTASRSEAVRLVEAAPDMYEALTGDQDAPESLRPIQWAWGLLQDYEEMLRRHEGQHPDPDAAWEHVSQVRRMLTLLEAALAKAEGRVSEHLHAEHTLRHAIRYALTAIDEHLEGARIDWHDVRGVLKRAIGETAGQ